MKTRVYLKYFVNDCSCNGIYLSRITDGVYATNLGDKQSKGKLWGSLVIDRNTALFFLFF